MNWTDWFGWFPNTTEQGWPFVYFIFFTCASVYLQGPRKSKYSNVFLAWLVYLIVYAIVTMFFFFFYSHKIIPYTFGSGVIDQIFWGVITGIFYFFIEVSMNFFTKALKIKKLDIKRT
jgi:hypothetical protein